jgi:hypothetical protein
MAYAIVGFLIGCLTRDMFRSLRWSAVRLFRGHKPDPGKFNRQFEQPRRAR